MFTPCFGGEHLARCPCIPAPPARSDPPWNCSACCPPIFAAVLVCTLLGGILAFAAARLAPRSYQAEAQLYVAAAQEGLTSGYAELQLTADYQELLTSRTMLESVISTLGLSTDTAHLKDQITILHPADTHILRIVAADSSPQRAADIANALAALALDDLSARMGTTPPRLVEQAAPPQRFSGPGAVFYAAFGAGHLAFCSALLSSACITCGMTTFIRRTIWSVALALRRWPASRMPRPAASIPGKAAAHERTCFEPPAGAGTPDG